MGAIATMTNEREPSWYTTELAIVAAFACPGEAQDKAALQAMTDRVIDLELDNRADLDHRRPGWHNHSPTAQAGEAPGGGGRVDQMLVAYLKGYPASRWHSLAKTCFHRLPDRLAAAVLLQAARIPPSKGGPWGMSLAELVRRQVELGQRLGYSPVRPFEPFKDVAALKECAWRGRQLLRREIERQLARAM